MIHLPHDVALVCLSATVSNAEELADWITTVRGPTEAVIEERRPVELHNLYLRRRQEQPRPPPAAHAGGRPAQPGGRAGSTTRRCACRGMPSRGRPRRRFFTPRRVEVIERLAGRGDAPGHHLHLQPQRLRRRPRRAASTPGSGSPPPTSGRGSEPSSTSAPPRLADADLDVLGFDRFLAGLEMGVAAHHAGMVPPFKEAVEACFTEGLTKAVFATETLALGVNMPARSVVIERLTKFSGERRELLTPGRVHPAHRTGRPAGHRRRRATPSCSGRRSSPSNRSPRSRSSRTYALRSAFRPTYNMAANLVRRYEPDEAHHLLNLSFAQFQADKAVVRLEARIERQHARLAAPAQRGAAASAATWRSTGALRADAQQSRDDAPGRGRSRRGRPHRSRR